MDKNLANLDVWIWRYRGERRGYRGYHFAASPAACQALIASVSAMKEAGGNTRRTVPLRRSALPSDPVGIDDPFDLLQKLVIEVGEGDLPLRIAGDRQTVTISVSYGSVHELQDALAEVQQRGGDFALTGETDLWFWRATS